MKKALVSLCNKQFVPQAKQLFASAYLYGGWSGDYVLIHDQDVTDDLDWFINRGIRTIPRRLLVEEEIYQFPPIVWSRCQAFTTDFSEWDFVLVLDADIMVRRNIDDVIPKDKLLVCIDPMDHLVWQFSHWPSVIKEQFGVGPYDLGFNVGVMFIPRSIMKENFYDEIREIIDVVKNHIVYPEQAVLGIYFSNKWDVLPRIYNMCPSHYINGFAFTLEDLDNLPLLHFYGCTNGPNDTFKPWFGSSPYHYKPWFETSPYYNEWRDTLRKADDINFRQQPPTPKTITPETTYIIEQNIIEFKAAYKTKILSSGTNIAKLFGPSWKHFFNLHVNENFRKCCGNPLNVKSQLPFHIPRLYNGRGSHDTELGLRFNDRQNNLASGTRPTF